MCALADWTKGRKLSKRLKRSPATALISTRRRRVNMRQKDGLPSIGYSHLRRLLTDTLLHLQGNRPFSEQRPQWSETRAARVQFPGTVTVSYKRPSAPGSRHLRASLLVTVCALM